MRRVFSRRAGLFKHLVRHEHDNMRRTRRHEDRQPSHQTNFGLCSGCLAACLKQEGQTEEEGALQKTCLLILANMSTVSRPSYKAQQHIPTCCLQLLGPGAVVRPFRGSSVVPLPNLPNSVVALVIRILTPKIKRQEKTFTCLPGALRASY